jgi:tetratricopeptide (TPR) repeat protein
MEAGEYEAAREHLVAALEWPESLGQGRPYEPEERLVWFLMGRVEEALGNEDEARAAFRVMTDAAADTDGPLTSLDLLTVRALDALDQVDEAMELTGARGAELEALSESLDESLDGRMVRRALLQKD